MKFLSKALDTSNITILNTFYDPGTRDFSTPDDVLDIVYKDMDTGKKYVETIHNPKYQVWITKPEYRTYDTILNFFDKKKCDCYTITYKERFKEIGNILGCSPKEAKYSPYVFQADMDIEHFYYNQFFLEYYNDNPKTLSKGYSDIENDIILINGFADPGEAPINCISYMDEDSRTMYTFVCIQDNIPHVDPDDKKYAVYEKLRSKFSTMTKDFVNRVDEFVEECKKDFTDSYGEIDYNVLIFEDELSMLTAYWEVVRRCENDYLLFWNAPYDISNLCERPKVLGKDPADIISDNEFGKREVYWKEDRNVEAHKRKHIFNLFTKFTVMDQMVNYAGIRSARGKIPSLKLNAIGKTELEDEKLDYSEYGNIRFFPYENFWKFVKYNIKDVLLQFGIENKTHDMDAVYETIHIDCVTPKEAFTSTAVIQNSLRLYAYLEEGQVMGSNRNKLFRVKQTEEEIAQAKKDKFAGAWVMSPAHCSPTGYKLLGVLNKYIHIHCIDMDITAEYPSGIRVTNLSNETMVGKVFLDHPEDFTPKMYSNMYIVDSDDEISYKKTNIADNLMMEALTEDNPTEFGRVYFGLPTFTEIAQHIEKNKDQFI